MSSCADIGTNGGVLCTLPVATFPLVDFDCVLSASDMETLMSGGTYLNVHTATYGSGMGCASAGGIASEPATEWSHGSEATCAGEIRGQLIPSNRFSGSSFFTTSASGAGSVPPTTSTAKGSSVVLVSDDGSTALVYGGITGAYLVRGTAACCSAPSLLSLCRHCRRPHRTDGRTHPRPGERDLECRRAGGTPRRYVTVLYSTLIRPAALHSFTLLFCRNTVLRMAPSRKDHDGSAVYCAAMWCTGRFLLCTPRCCLGSRHQRAFHQHGVPECPHSREPCRRDTRTVCRCVPC